MDLSNEQERIGVILTKIETYWPDWIEWYSSLDWKKKGHLNKRILVEGEKFIKFGMWEYQEYGIFTDKPGQKARRLAQQREWIKPSEKAEEEQRKLRQELALKHGFDLEKMGIIPKL